MTFEEAIKKAIKVYFESDEDELGMDKVKPRKYNKKYFEDREKEYLGDKKKKDKKDAD